MRSEVVRCPRCEGYSESIYRCGLCGFDLAEHELRILDERPDQDLEDLVDVAFRYQCVDCGRTRALELDYQDLGTIVRIGCPRCGRATRHRPTGKDRYWPYWGLLQERDESPADHPAVSTAL